jgi:hypothetical protein
MESEYLKLGLIVTTFQVVTGIVLAEVIGHLGIYRLRMAWYSILASIFLGFVVLLVFAAVAEISTVALLSVSTNPSTISLFFTGWMLFRLYRKNKRKRIDKSEGT